MHINNELWQYKWGKKYVTIYTPQNKRHNILKCDVFIALLGEAEYERRLEDTVEWSYHSWDYSVCPSDFGLKILDYTPATIKEYIVNTLVP